MVKLSPGGESDEAKTSAIQGCFLSWISFSVKGGVGLPLPSHTCLESSLCGPGHTLDHYLVSSHSVKKNTKTICSPVSEELLGVGASWTALALLSCVLSGSSEQAGVLGSPLFHPRDPQPEALSSPGKGSLGNIPDLQTRLAQRWPHARDNHFLVGCLPSWTPWAQPGWWPYTWPRGRAGGKVLLRVKAQSEAAGAAPWCKVSPVAPWDLERACGPLGFHSLLAHDILTQLHPFQVWDTCCFVRELAPLLLLLLLLLLLIATFYSVTGPGLSTLHNHFM